MNLGKILRGTVVRGHRVASGLAADCPWPGGSVRRQLPLMAQHGMPVDDSDEPKQSAWVLVASILLPGLGMIIMGILAFNLFNTKEHRIPVMVSHTLRAANEIQRDYADKPTFRDLSLMPVNDLRHGHLFWADTFGKGGAHGIVGKPGGLVDLWKNGMTIQSGAHAPKWMHGVTARNFLITDAGTSLNAKECIELSRSVGASAYATFVGNTQVNAMPGRGNSNISTALLTKACARGAQPITWVFGH